MIIDNLRVVLAFAALLVTACLYHSFGVKSALAPLCAVATAALWFSLWGSFGLLSIGGWLFYALAAAGLLFLLWRHLLQKKKFPLPGTGFWFFAAAGALIILLLALRQPVFTTWDEFSFWGTAGKLVKTSGQMYTTAPIGWNWPTTQSPALILFGHFFQFFGQSFIPWQTYAAADIFQFAAIAALLAPFDKKHWPAAVPALVTAVLAPYVFVHYSGIQKVSQVYLDSLGDIPMGLWFAAAMACGFCFKSKLAGAVPLCLALATLTLTKETGLLLALVAGAAVFCDVLFAKTESKTRVSQRFKNAAWRGGPALLTPVVAYGAWTLYLALAKGIDRVGDAGGKENMSQLQMLFTFVRDLFSPKSDFYNEVGSGMSQLFFKTKTTLLGSSAVAALAVLALLALAFFLSKSKAHRRRTLVFGAVSLLGFVAYTLMIFMSYLYLFRAELVLIGYERYLYPYLIGWTLAALLLLGITATETGRRPALANAALLAVCAAFLVLVGRAVPIGYTPIGLHSEEYATQRAFSDKIAAWRRALPQDSLTFLVFSDDDGSGFFRTCYEMLPLQVDYSFGGDSIVESEYLKEEGTYSHHTLTAEEWRAYLTEKGVTHVLIDEADEAFAQLYGEVFADGMSNYFDEGVHLYRVEGAGSELQLLPLGAP